MLKFVSSLFDVILPSPLFEVFSMTPFEPDAKPESGFGKKMLYKSALVLDCCLTQDCEYPQQITTKKKKNNPAADSYFTL